MHSDTNSDAVLAVRCDPWQDDSEVARRVVTQKSATVHGVPAVCRYAVARLRPHLLPILLD
jgi:SOS response regulatory protein OraA/RecX